MTVPRWRIQIAVRDLASPDPSAVRWESVGPSGDDSTPYEYPSIEEARVMARWLYPDVPRDRVRFLEVQVER